MLAGRPCIVLQSEIWDPRKQKQRETGVVLPGRDWRTAVPTRRWPWTRSRHFPASPRPAPPRPAGTQSSSPHRQSDPPASSPFSSSLAPAFSLSKFIPGRDLRRKRAMTVYLGMLRLGRLYIASLGAQGARTLFSRPWQNSKWHCVRPFRYPEQLPEKRGGWAVPRRRELGSSAELDRD